MNETDLRTALRELAGPADAPVAAARAAVARRVQRRRVIRYTGVACAGVAAIGVVGTIAIAADRDATRPARITTAEGTIVHSSRFGYTVTVPPGWELQPVQEYENASLPAILIADHDYAPATLGADCASSVEQRGIRVLIQERAYRDRSDQPPLLWRRPRPFGPDSATPLETQPLTPLCRRLVQSVSFDDEGRSFHVGITVGPGTDPGRIDEMYRMLDSLRFDRDAEVKPAPSDGATTTTLG